MSATRTIYAGLRQVGLAEEDERRDFFERVTGKRRLTVMSPSERAAVVTELRRMGFRSAPRKGGLSGPYAKKLQALWIAGWNLGLVRNRSDQALLSFVRRQTGIENTAWLHDDRDAKRVIEALKAWLARDGGVDWTEGRGRPRWLRDHGAKIALAQFDRLRTGEDERFSDAVFAVAGEKGGGLAVMRAADWRLVCNAFGERIRAAAD